MHFKNDDRIDTSSWSSCSCRPPWSSCTCHPPWSSCTCHPPWSPFSTPNLDDSSIPVQAGYPDHCSHPGHSHCPGRNRCITVLGFSPLLKLKYTNHPDKRSDRPKKLSIWMWTKNSTKHSGKRLHPYPPLPPPSQRAMSSPHTRHAFQKGASLIFALAYLRICGPGG